MSSRKSIVCGGVFRKIYDIRLARSASSLAQFLQILIDPRFSTILKCSGLSPPEREA